MGRYNRASPALEDFNAHKTRHESGGADAIATLGAITVTGGLTMGANDITFTTGGITMTDGGKVYIHINKEVM